MQQTNYKGFLVGITPGLLSLNNPKDLSSCWHAHSVILTIDSQGRINLSFNWEGNNYRTANCSQLKPDYYQLKLECNGGWDDQAFLWVYRREGGIVITGDWVSGTDSEVWGKFELMK